MDSGWFFWREMRQAPGLLLILVLIVVAGTGTVAAAPTNRQNAHPFTRFPVLPTRAKVGVGDDRHVVTFASLGWTTQTVTGINPTVDLYLPGPGSVILGPTSILTLTYTRSPLLDGRNSTLSVLMNNIAVAGWSLKAGAYGRHTISVVIGPTTLIANGYNHLQLSFGLRDRLAQVCGFTDPSLNVTVYDSSRFDFDVRGKTEALFQPDLARLPAPFVTPGAAVPAHITVGLPAIASTTELTGIGQVLARLGEDVPTSPPTITTVLAAALPRQAPGRDLLLVGTPLDNPAIAQLSVTTPISLTGGLWRDMRGTPFPPDEGLILETANPWDAAHGTLVISGNGQEGVRRAALMLASGTLRRLLHGSFALLPQPPLLPPERQAPHAGITLADLGYASTTVEGLGDHSTHFNFDVQQLPARPGQLTLVYGHGATADSTVSSVRVDLNGLPLLSRRLAENDPPRMQWSISLPVDHLRLGTNELTVRFFLNAWGANCQVPPYSSLWGAVDATSSITMPGTQGTGDPDLSLLPFPLVHDGDAGGTVLVAPFGTVSQRDVLNLAVLLGAQSRLDTPQITVLPTTQATDDRLRGHMVLIDGMRDANPLIARLMPQLPLQAVAGAPQLQLSGQTASLEATAHEQGAVGVVEEMSSPWDSTQTVVLVSATQPGLLPLARRAIFGNGLGGTVATIDVLGRIQSFDTRTAEQLAPPAPSAGRPILLLSLLGLALLLLVLMGAAIRRQRAGLAS